jgi:hypothetical protein
MARATRSAAPAASPGRRDYPQARLVAFGIALHALLVYSIFDVHFLTPLVHGMEPATAHFAAPAKRLVVIVAGRGSHSSANQLNLCRFVTELTRVCHKSAYVKLKRGV